MCLGIPGKIITKWHDSQSNIPMANVDFGGIKREVCLVYTPDAMINDYIMVHVGFAISKIDEQAAQDTLNIFKQQGTVSKELLEDKP